MNDFVRMLRSAFSLEDGKASPEEIRKTILSGAQVRGTNMCILVLAIFVASIGLNMNSTAVIIGAMLISPLMGGIMAVGYGIAVNDLTLSKKAFYGLAFQVCICIITSTLYFSLSPISTAHSELLARTTPTIWDVLIAVCGGLAGTIGVTREEKTNVLPGVAIATALMPPLCTAGYGIATRSMTFFLGAMYLFFINSFFICVSTVVIVCFMRLPRRKYVDQAARRKVHVTIGVIAVITVLPSIYLAYQIVNDSLTENNVQEYITQEFNFTDTLVVRSSLDTKEKTINVALLGKRLDDGRIQELENALETHSLSGMKLKVTQTELSEGMGYDDIQALIESELDISQKQSSLVNQSKELESLKAELVNYKAKLMDYQSREIDMEAFTSELYSLYPQITDCSAGQQSFWNKETGEQAAGFVAVVTVPEELEGKQRGQLISWLETKSNGLPVYLYENVVPDEDVEILEPVA